MLHYYNIYIYKLKSTTEIPNEPRRTIKYNVCRITVEYNKIGLHGKEKITYQIVGEIRSL